MISRFTRAMSTVANVQPSLLTSISNNVAYITLNRPKVLNSLNVDMCSEMKNLLIDWRKTSESDLKTKPIGAFLMSGAGGKSFCAGGDVKSVYNELVSMRSAGHGNEIGTGKKGLVSNDFFRLEYEMNYLLGTSPIPQVSIWNGIVMGGGVGISVLGEFRIATEKTMFAMPETAIGLFPDVGSSAWLPHLQGGQGLYIGLTGVRLNASDLLYTGIATHYLPSIELEKVENEIISTCSSDPKVARDQIKKILLSASEECKPDTNKAVIEPNKDAINRCFGNATSAEGILEALIAEEEKKEWAENTIKLINKMSPSSIKLTIAQCNAGKDLDLKGCLEMEYRLMMGCMRHLDFEEGIRALLVDKDNKPVWTPSTLNEVSDELIQNYFAPLKDKELNLSAFE